jgi:chemotaxis-related protein WspB
MLLIMCHCGANRYAIDSRHVGEVLPRVNLQRLSGSPPWLAGLLICRGNALPVMDLSQLTESRPCPDRLSSRIVVLRLQLEGVPQHLGVLVEGASLCETDDQSDKDGRQPARAAWGALRIDDLGAFQLLDIPRLLSEDRQAILFPADKDL